MDVPTDSIQDMPSFLSISATLLNEKFVFPDSMRLTYCGETPSFSVRTTVTGTLTRCSFCCIVANCRNKKKSWDAVLHEISPKVNREQTLFNQKKILIKMKHKEEL